ncbi:MAG: sigma 54-interacting transcriptional regulator [Candidatus Cloacimonadales bacterium]
MNMLIRDELSAFATDNYKMTGNIVSQLQSDESGIIEIVGESGSGKTYIFRKLYADLSEENLQLKVFVPNIFKYNQMYGVLRLISDITKTKFAELLKSAQAKNIVAKYDLFYYISEHICNANLLKSTTVMIYEGYFMDSYTNDFIHYITEYSTEVAINFIVFNREKRYPFSQVYKIPKPTSEDLRRIIRKLSDNEKDFVKESELINEISGGNLFLIEYLLEKFEENQQKIDFSSYLDKAISVETIHAERLSVLNSKQLDLLMLIFLVGEGADLTTLHKLNGKAKTDKALAELSKNDFIFEINDNYYVKKVSAVHKELYNQPQEKQLELFQLIIDKLPPEKNQDFKVKVNLYDRSTIETIEKKLELLNDYEALKSLLLRLQKELRTPADKIANLIKIGDANNYLHQTNQAVENFREALKLSVDNNLPAETVLHKFAQSLYNINSSAFALELIKKYSPDSIEPIASCELLLLKSEILTEMENFNDALEALNIAYDQVEEIADNTQRNRILAKYRKLRGKIYYYVNEWSKAEDEFNRALELYERVEDFDGMAAISNNIGSLAMVKGDWKTAELSYMKSVEYEKRNFNLDGLSVTYSNLGSLYDDKSNYKQSLTYLQKALRLQKLLGNKYKITNIYNNIGVTYMDNGEFRKAEEAFLESLQISFDVHQHKNLIATLNNLGALYFRWGNFKTAIDYYERAVKHSKADNFVEGLCQSYNNIGELYESRGDFEIALDFYQKGEDLISNINDQFMKAELSGNIGSVLTNLHRFKHAYKYLVESFDFFKSLGALDKIIESSHKQAFYFIKTRNYESAAYHLEEAQKLSEEIQSDKLIGKTYFMRSMLEKNDPKLRQQHLEAAIEYFVKSKNDFDLVLANLEYADLLLSQEEWEQALQILAKNRKLIIEFEVLNLLEKNDLLAKSIKKKYSKELRENKSQEQLLGQFYELTNDLNQISDFDLLLETAIKKLVTFSKADGGMFCMYKNQNVKDSWEYISTERVDIKDDDFKVVLNVVEDAYKKGTIYNEKQPHFAPEFNNIIAFPLSVRNEKKGVISLFTKYGSHYFSENMYNLLSALCNQIVVIVENISYTNLQKKHETIREELASSSSFSNIIGKSKKLQDVFSMIEKIKNTDTSVLLEGASGTGKELIARAIHFNSNRKNKPFIAQYCGALPETLLESELFGHVKGSFTGATHDKKGLFEVANGGTFFLDEIADISLSTQAKLLRFLQEGEIKRVGAISTQKVDVRVICATNVSLKDKVDKGDFRLDLYYRLNVIKMDIPSLKERKSDIPLLAVHFLDKFCKKTKKKVNGITDEAMGYLKVYNWPGNIRQLENEIERAVTLSDEDQFITSKDLSEEILKFEDNTETINLLEKESLKSAVEKLEVSMIRKMLRQVDWNQTKAAKELGLSRQGLIKKIQRYGISRER